MNMDNYNYYNDARVQASMITPAYEVTASNDVVTTVELTDALVENMVEDGIVAKDFDGVLTLNTNYEACSLCRGSGRCTNPSIDAGGLSGDDFHDDPDFADDYFGGVYDVTCSSCKGNRVVPTLTFPEKIAAAVQQWEQDQWDWVEESCAERRMGA